MAAAPATRTAGTRVVTPEVVTARASLVRVRASRGARPPSARERRGARLRRGARVTVLLADLVELDVGPVAHGGHFVARAGDGRVVFVRHALPGERVVARVTEVRAGYLRADAVRVLAA